LPFNWPEQTPGACCTGGFKHEVQQTPGIFLRKTSLVDYPGKVAPVFFFSGCSLRCPWCHNRELVLGGGALSSLEEGMALVEKRRSLFGGLVLSGGEPAMYAGLPELIGRVKGLGLALKLDTNGMHPRMLETLFSNEAARPDYIALDLKLAPRRYAGLAAPGYDGEVPGEKLKKSAGLIAASGVAHEYRTLVFGGGFIGPRDIEELAPLVDGAPWYFRDFRPGNCVDPVWDSAPPPEAGAAWNLAALAGALGKNALVPGVSQNPVPVNPSPV
jgi:pyruvate formate lyase activating enzyme